MSNEKEKQQKELVASARPYTGRENMVHWMAGLPLTDKNTYEFKRILDELIPTDYIVWNREGGFRIHRKRELLEL